MANQIAVQVNQLDDSSSAGIIRHHTIRIDRPESKGGHDAGPMGGELLLTALGGCFMSNLLAAIKARDAAIGDVRLTITGTLASTPSRFESIEMRVSAMHEDLDLLEKLVAISERACISANTLRGGVELTTVVV